MKIKRKQNKRRRKTISSFCCQFCMNYFIRLVSPLQKYIGPISKVCPKCGKEHKYEYEYEGR